MTRLTLPPGAGAFRPAQASIGIDGCPAGWFFVWFEPNGTATYGVVPRLIALISEVQKPACVLIDIPIGLPDGPSARCCDLQARDALGSPRGRSVFTAPARAALAAEDYCDAKRRHREATGKGLSRQTFNLLGKIREVDELIRTNQDARSLLRETHPEVCFWSLNGQRSVIEGKKRTLGLEKRVRVLERVWPGAAVAVHHILYGGNPFQRACVGRDDVVDACVAAVTASMGCSALRRLPAVSEKDGEGLPMHIWYPQPVDRRR